MPSDRPAWFIDADYAAQSVIHMNAIKYEERSDWTEQGFYQELQKFEATPYENFVVIGNTENVSPNHFFNVQEYLEAVARFSNTYKNEDGSIGYEGETGWTKETVLDNMTSAFNVSAWEHYTQAGQFSGLNPSNEFDTNAYLNAAAARLNAYVNPDGSKGWAGHLWAPADILAQYREAGVNPIMAMYTDGEYGQPWGMRPSEVGTENRVAPADPDWTPWGPAADPFEPAETKILTTETETVIGSRGVNTLFKGVVNGAQSTLNQDDVILGGEGANNTLQVSLLNDFYGFKGVTGADGTLSPNVSGVAHVELANDFTERPELFSASWMAGVTQWTLDDKGGRPISLTGMSNTGVTVNVENLPQGETSIIFDDAAVSGGEDTLTIGLSGVGERAPATFLVNGIEDMTLSPQDGTENRVDSSSLTGPVLRVAGGGQLELVTVAGSLLNFDASASSGGVSANLAAAQGLQSARGGYGNDNFILPGGTSPGVALNGGAGFDRVTLTSSGDYGAPAWTNIEEVALAGDMNISISAINMPRLSAVALVSPLATATVSGAMDEFAVNDTAFNGQPGQPVVNVNGDQLRAASYNAQGIGTHRPHFTTNASQEVRLNVEANENAQGQPQTSFGGQISAPAARDVSVNAEGALEGVRIHAPQAAFINFDAKYGGSAELYGREGGNATVLFTNGDDFRLGGDLSGIGHLSIRQNSGAFTEATGTKGLLGVGDIEITGAGEGQGDEAPTAALGAIGGTSQTGGINLSASSLAGLSLGTIANRDAISMNIADMSGDIHLGSINPGTGVAGNVSLKAAGTGSLLFDGTGPNIRGGIISIEAGDLQGGLGAANGEEKDPGTLAINAETLVYKGSKGQDNILVHVSRDAAIETGAGDDLVSIAPLSAWGRVNIDVALGEGNDTLAISQPDYGMAILTVSDFASGDKLTGTIAANGANATNVSSFLSNLLGRMVFSSDLTPMQDGAGMLLGDTAWYFTRQITGAASDIGVVAVENVEGPEMQILAASE